VPCERTIFSEFDIVIVTETIENTLIQGLINLRLHNVTVRHGLSNFIAS
jgi:hypothetical protein